GGVSAEILPLKPYRGPGRHRGCTVAGCSLRSFTCSRLPDRSHKQSVARDGHDIVSSLRMVPAQVGTAHESRNTFEIQNTVRMTVTAQGQPRIKLLQPSGQLVPVVQPFVKRIVID